MENMDGELRKRDPGAKEMMEMPDGSLADVTDKTPEERREMLDDYGN